MYYEDLPKASPSRRRMTSNNLEIKKNDPVMTPLLEQAPGEPKQEDFGSNDYFNYSIKKKSMCKFWPFISKLKLNELILLVLMIKLVPKLWLVYFVGYQSPPYSLYLPIPLAYSSFIYLLMCFSVIFGLFPLLSNNRAHFLESNSAFFLVFRSKNDLRGAVKLQKVCFPVFHPKQAIIHSTIWIVK